MGANWPLTGRAEELGVIAALLTGGGEHGGVAIAGRSGVGKSRLAREAVATAAQVGWTVRWVVGTITARSIPLGSFAEWTDGLIDNPLRLVHHVIAKVTTAQPGARVLVAVDDAHLLDDLSAFVVHQLMLQGVATVIATIRSGEPVPDAVTALWKDGPLRRLELQPLSRFDSDALLQAALNGRIGSDCSEQMWRYTRGNVLFLRHLVEQELTAGRLVGIDGEWQWLGKVAVSPSLVDLVELQIGAVPEPVREVVDLVAVAEPMERTCLLSLVETEVVEEAERRGLIAVSSTPRTDLVHVGHPLYGEVRLEQSGPLRLQRLRGRVATAMSSPECEDVADRVRLGLLWLESDLAPDAVVLLGAAQSAIARLDLELTERLADAAARAGAGSEANVLRGHALILLNRGAEAERILESLSPDELPPGTAGEVLHLRAANLLWPLGRPEDSWAVIEQALDRSAGGLVHQLRAFRAVQLAMAARPEDAMALMQSIDRSELGVKHAVVAIWAEVIALGDIGCARAAADAAAKGYELACGSSEATYQGAGLTDFHVSAMLVAGCIPAAVAAAERTFEMCENVPGSSRSVATAVVGMAALGSGDLRTATRRLDSAIADLQARGDTTGVRHRFMITHTEVLARSGRAELATEALARMRASQHPSLTYVESERLLSAAWVAAVRGRVTQARELARQAADFARSRGQLGREVLCLQTAVQFGDVTVVDRLVELAGLVDGPRAAVAARYARAVTDADPDGMTTACCDFEAMGDLCAAADAAAQASVAYARDHRRGAALTTSASANRLAERCGSASPALLAAESPLSLTDREREIVGLVAQGLSNKEIAAAISTSVRTVEGHIYRVMSRSGVGRTELSVLMRHQDGVPAAPHR